MQSKNPSFLNINTSQNISRPQLPKLNQDIDDIYCEEDLYGYPVLRMYGITNEGISVCALIKDFLPYFYVQAPPNLKNLDIDEFKKVICSKLKNSNNGAQYIEETIVQKIEFEKKINILNYRENIEEFIKITLIAPKFVSTLREIFETGFSFNNIHFNNTTFESKVNFPLRYMIDRGIVGMSWNTLPHGKYKLKKESMKTTTCQIEALISYKDIISHAPEGEYSRIAPIRILSIDIECAAPQGRFPSAQIDPIIQIANICIEFGKSEPIVQKLFSYKSCAPIVGADVECTEEENQMLSNWKDFILKLDPDIITGYNINGFDIPYLFGRAEKLKVNNFSKLSRVIDSQCKVKYATAKSKSFKNREFTDVNLSGRIMLDMYIYVMKEYKLRSFSLNNVSFNFLGEQKEDVHHSLIYDLWKTDEYTRRRLGVYCLKDAYLPLKLAEKMMTLYNYTEMCRVTCTPLSFILTRGQQIKVSSQLHRKALEKGFIIPNVKAQGTDSDEEGFEGAFVLDPITAYYEIPIVTLDFASLYPSIMMAHNLCYSTLIPPGQEKHMNPDDYYHTPNGDYFVKEHIRKGILPVILEELISARKKAKDDLKKATDPNLKAVLDGRQLALKISANSVYGFTGAQVGQLPCLNISASVTAIGRLMIEKTRDLVTSRYNTDNGYKFNSQVIYGDTDSVMIKFGVSTLIEAMELGKDASEFVSEKFKKPIKIEFEKVYYPYLLMKKKKYAGVIWTKPDKYDKIDTKGLEAVRRDNCELVRETVETVLKKILLDRSVDDAIKYCKGLISDLLQNKIDISYLIISKSLSKKAANEETTKQNKKNTYVGKQAHVELAEKMRKRDEGNKIYNIGTAPNVGDRVAYVIVKGTKGSKNYENAEDPKYVLEHDLPIDTNYYLENQLKKPLSRIFKPIINNPEKTLFSK